MVDAVIAGGGVDGSGGQARAAGRGEWYDVGAAGLSGAVALARARRAVLVVDGGQPRNAPAAHVHNYLSRDGAAPSELLAVGRAEVTGYGGRIISGHVTSAARLDSQDDRGGFRVTLTDGASVYARRLLVATGLVDELPDVPGVAERWGRDVLHCPYCHGWEVRDQALGVLATGPLAVHQAQLFRQWSADVTLFLHTEPEPTVEESEQLAARGITVVRGKVASLEVTDDHLSGVRLASGQVVPRQAVVVGPRVAARADVLTSLGLEVTEQRVAGQVIGAYVATDPTGATAVPGVWVAGNVADLMAQVIAAADAGLRAAAAINADLVAEDIERAVAARRNPSPIAAELAAQDAGRRCPSPRALRGGAVVTGRHTPHAHDHQGDGPGDGAMGEAFWNERYRSRDALWSGNPNPQLVAEAADLVPGTALDVGCGEGADAIWLAERGWRVTAVDFSVVALERGAAQAAERGAAVARRIDWRHEDLTAWVPAEASYDLVSAQFFLHLPKEPREAIFRVLAASVAPGGSLLIVGHHPSDLQTTIPRPPLPELFFTASDVAALLDTHGWDIAVNAARERGATDPQGRTVTIHDAVLRARRR